MFSKIYRGFEFPKQQVIYFWKLFKHYNVVNKPRVFWAELFCITTSKYNFSYPRRILNNISSIFTKLFRCLQIHLKSINAYLIIHRVQILIKSKNEIAFYTYLCSILIIQIKMTYILHLLFDLKLVIFCFTFVATIFLLELTDSIREDINENKLNIHFLIYVQLLNR